MPSFLHGVWASYSGPHACKSNPYWLSSQVSNVIFSYTQTFVWNDRLKFMDSSISSRQDWDSVQRRVKTGLLQFMWVDSVHPLLALSSVISLGQLAPAHRKNIYTMKLTNAMSRAFLSLLLPFLDTLSPFYPPYFSPPFIFFPSLYKIFSFF